MSKPDLASGWRFDEKGILKAPSKMPIPVESDEQYESDSDEEELVS
jgi:hypothetical protein